MVDIKIPDVPKELTAPADADLFVANDTSDIGDSVDGSTTHMSFLTFKTWLTTFLNSATQTLTNKTLDDFSNTIMADTVHEAIRNTSGGTLLKGTPVAASGFHIGSGLVTVVKADANNSSAMPCIGIVQADIVNNASGAMIEIGHLAGIDTSSFSVGDPLYVSETAGEITNIRPTAADAGVQKIAEVLRSHATLGVVEIFGAGRSNDIPNRMSTAILRIADSSDLTKVAMFDTSAISAATTRTITVPDENVDLSAIGAIASTTAAGIAELATIAEVDIGTDTGRIITPAGLAGSALQTKVTGIATGAEVNVQSDWNAGSGDAFIANKPTIPTVDDTVYGASWNSNTDAPTKNAVYAKIEDVTGGGVNTSGTPVANDFARFTDADTIEGRSYAETKADLSLEIGVDIQAYDTVLDNTTASYITAEETKLAGIETLADVTDTANVTAAGAVMDSEVDVDIKTLALPANTTISTFGATLVDDAAASNARTTLGLGSNSLIDEASVIEWRANTANKGLTTDIVWTSAEVVTLTDAASIAVDMSTFINAKVTLGGNRTLVNPSNVKEGQSGCIEVIQDGTGSRTLAFGTNYEFRGGISPTLTTAANASDLLFYYVISSTRIFISSSLEIS